ncbi:hypothetical protein AMJ47_00345 [Parcubacteria bacterium DG_72]|nr:MAG: hypothetical protein AMJ47_00345 [Parcubacteria bacterium DG_72]
MAKKVLIITYHFPPINVIASRRFGEMAPLMKQFDWETYVLTTKSRGELPVLIPEEDIIRIGAHCDSGKRLVKEEGFKDIPVFLKSIYSLYRKFNIRLESIDRFVFSWRKEVLRNIDKIKEISPDVIIATTSPTVCLWLGRDLSKILKIPWIADFRDPCSLYNPCKFPFIKTIDRIIDKNIVKTACLITTIGPYLAEVMSRFYKKEAHVIFNGFKQEKLEFLQQRTENKEKIVYYAGRFHPHRLTAVKLFIDWLAQTDQNIRLVIRSLGPEQANQEILSSMRKTDKVDLLEPASASQVLKEEKRADFLAIFEDLSKDEVFKGTMTGKLFEYLPFSGTILAVARPDSDMNFVLKQTNRGEVVSNFKDLDAFFQKQKPVPNLEKLKTFTREFQTQKLCTTLNKII